MIPGDVHSEELRTLGQTLPKLIERGRADATVNKYKTAWQKWVEWGGKKGITTRPAKPFYIALYFTFMFTTEAKKGAITSAFYGIRWGHHIVGLPSPTDNELVKLTFEGCLRSFSAPKSKKEPISIEVLKQIVDSYDSENSNALDQRFKVLSLLCFACFLRINEILKIRLKHIKVKQNHLELFLEHSKTDQHRERNTVYITRTDTNYCPVTHTVNFLKNVNLDVKLDSEAFFILTLHKTKKRHVASKTKGISYTRVYDIFHEHLSKLKIDSSSYGLHSFRSGGASVAANNGVSDRQISKHGRWSTEVARNGYIKDNKKRRLDVTVALGL